MKRISLFVLSCLLFASCTKKTDNYYTNSTPAYIVSGIENIKLQANVIEEAALNLTVQYLDSTQETVTLSFSGLPAGVTMDTSAILTGIPTFSTYLLFYDTSVNNPAAAGTYPITITSTGSLTGQRFYTFNLIVEPVPSYTATIVGKYTQCSSSCGTGNVYTDSVYNDATIVNKIYFHNFMNTGQTVYANVVGTQSPEFIINLPQQTVGGYNFTQTQGEAYSNQIFFNGIEYTYNGNNFDCSMTMTH